jgi:hypothetical protein
MDKYVGSSEKVSLTHESVVASTPDLVIRSLDCINAESS